MGANPSHGLRVQLLVAGELGVSTKRFEDHLALGIAHRTLGLL